MDPEQLKTIEGKLPGWSAMQEMFERAGQIVLPPDTSHLFRTGFAMAIEEGHACYFWDRSGMGGFKEAHRFAGVIDEDYRGEWLVKLVNFHKSKSLVIEHGDKIVQGVFQERIEAEFPVVDTLPETARGAGGFGSTGS